MGEPRGTRRDGRLTLAPGPGLEPSLSDGDHARRLQILGVAATGIAHEINNILTPMAAAAGSALETPHDRARMQEALVLAERCACRAARVAEAILALAAPSRRRAGEAAEVAQAIDVVLADVRDEVRGLGIEVALRIDRGCRAAVDSAVLESILGNLCTNAIRSMRGGGGLLRIGVSTDGPRRSKDQETPRGNGISIVGGCSTWNTLEGPGRFGVVVITVEDSGCGIEPARVGEIFRPFESSLDRGVGGGGSGVGLAITRSLIEAAGGSLTVASSPGVGSRFEIRLPRAADEAIASRPDAAPLRRSA